jgi:glycosyltransferase involved in cell wall biosynthesis
MRIRIVAPIWYPVPPVGYSGVELVVALLADELSRRGHDVTVVANGESAPAGTLLATTPSSPEKGSIGDPWYETYHALRAYEDLDDVDVVHDHSGVIGPALASRHATVPPVVHTLHGPWTPEARRLYGLIDQDVHLVAISHSQRRANRDVRYAATVHNGVDPDAYPLKRRPDDHLVYVGRASADKNPDGAIRIARASARPLKLVIKRHEPAERDYWESEIVPILGSDIEVFEDIDHEAKVRLLQDAYAMVFPIQWEEPFGLVMVEAMSCGTPVIAPPLGAAKEIIDHGCSGFLCDSEAEMARAVGHVEVLDRTECRRHVTEHFSATRMAYEYEQLFVRTLEREGGRTPRWRPRTHRTAWAEQWDRPA